MKEQQQVCLCFFFILGLLPSARCRFDQILFNIFRFCQRSACVCARTIVLSLSACMWFFFFVLFDCPKRIEEEIFTGGVDVSQTVITRIDSEQHEMCLLCTEAPRKIVSICLLLVL